MTEETYWIKWVGIFSCTLVVSIASCTAHENYVDAQQVLAGNDPIAVKCSKTQSSDKSMCTAYILGRGK